MSLPIHHDPQGRRPHPVLPLPGDLGLGLARGRVHEFCGPARLTLAALTLALGEGPVLWISPAWLSERLYPGGLAEFAHPGRLIFAQPRRPEDVLWSMEEALRSGAVPLVLADLPEPPPLTPTRRLQLAAEAGAEAVSTRGLGLAPLGLLLTPAEGGAAGVDSRWHLAAAPSGSTLNAHRAAWVLQRLRARLAPPGRWRLENPADGRVTGTPLTMT
jgi:protein ImuA